MEGEITHRFRADEGETEHELKVFSLNSGFTYDFASEKLEFLKYFNNY